MITMEWKRLLEGKEPFEDLEVEQIAKYLLNLISTESDPLKVIEYTNDLEELLGKGEWLTRKVKRIANELARGNVPDLALATEKRSKVKKMRDEIVLKIKSKYGLP